MDLAIFNGLPFSEVKRSREPPSSAHQSSGTKYKMYAIRRPKQHWKASIIETLWWKTQTCDSGDQIGLFLKGLNTKFSLKEPEYIGWLLREFESQYLCQNYWGYFLDNFFGKLGTFCSTIWPHRCAKWIIDKEKGSIDNKIIVPILLNSLHKYLIVIGTKVKCSLYLQVCHRDIGGGRYVRTLRRTCPLYRWGLRCPSFVVARASLPQPGNLLELRYSECHCETKKEIGS